LRKPSRTFEISYLKQPIRNVSISNVKLQICNFPLELIPETSSENRFQWFARIGLVHQAQCRHTSSLAFRLFTCQRTRTILRSFETTGRQLFTASAVHPHQSLSSFRQTSASEGRGIIATTSTLSIKPGRIQDSEITHRPMPTIHSSANPDQLDSTSRSEDTVQYRLL